MKLFKTSASILMLGMRKSEGVAVAYAMTLPQIGARKNLRGFDDHTIKVWPHALASNHWSLPSMLGKPFFANQSNDSQTSSSP